VEKNVDVISMSWTLDGGTPEALQRLQRAVEDAEEKNIIMYCAAKDEGRDKDDKKATVYPYSCGPHSIKRVGATDKYGTKLTYVPPQTDYLLPGQGLAEAEGIDASKLNLNPNKRMDEGSSEATAAAAGLAALILVSFGVIKGEQGVKAVRKHMGMVFDSILVGDDTRYVMTSIFSDAVKSTTPEAPAGKPHLAAQQDPFSKMKARMEEVVSQCCVMLDHKRPKDWPQTANIGLEKTKPEQNSVDLWRSKS
jgi:subtilisin family serine protease